jgi:hypothetical protein
MIIYYIIRYIGDSHLPESRSLRSSADAVISSPNAASKFSGSLLPNNNSSEALTVCVNS